MTDPLGRIAALPGVADAVEDARRAVDRLLEHRVLRNRSAEVSAESALRGARASAALEGADIPLDDILACDVAPPLVRGALRVHGELAAQVPTWRLAPRQVLARLHVLAAADLGISDQLGRPRRPDTGICGPPLDLGSPPPAAEVAARLDALADMIVVHRPTESTPRSPAPAPPAVVVAAVVHGELLGLRPFGSADGIVARAAGRLTLMAAGLDPNGLVVVEAGHAELGPAYSEALRGYLRGTSAGVAGWVRHCATAVVLGARESLAVCEALRRG